MASWSSSTSRHSRSATSPGIRGNAKLNETANDPAQPESEPDESMGAWMLDPVSTEPSIFFIIGSPTHSKW